MPSYISLPSLRTFTFRSRVAQRQRRWQVYELAKRNWDEHHPEASPAQRDLASVEIARRLGIAQVMAGLRGRQEIRTMRGKRVARFAAAA